MTEMAELAGEDDAGRGLAALAAGRWADARAALEIAAADEPRPDVLDGLGEALWWLGEPGAAIGYRERAFVGFRRADRPERAARTAVALCVDYWVNFGNHAAGSGWLARAETVLKGCAAGPAHAWVGLMRAYAAAGLEEASGLIRHVVDRARETGDIDLELTGLSDLGGRLVAAGRVDEGLALIDQALAGALAGECDRLETVVWASCTMLGACELVGDLARASEWLRVIDEFTARYGCPFMYVTCRTHYAGLLLARGRWDQAEHELTAAVHMSGRAGPAPRAMAIARLADLRLRQGRLEEAEAYLGECDDQLVAARIRRLRGEPERAAGLLEAHLEGCAGRVVETASTLALLVQVLLDAGRPDDAHTCVDRLAALAAVQPGGYVAALAAGAKGHLAAAAGDLPVAAEHFHAALTALVRLDLPFEAAELRLALARSCAADRREVAVAEAGTALATFQRLDATVHADAAAAVLRSLGAPGRRTPRSGTALTRREQEVLQLIGVGLTNPEIAQRLFISRKTAAHHVSSVLAKLGVRNRAEAVAHAARSRPPDRPDSMPIG